MNVRDYFLFGNPNTNITTDSNLTPDMKEYYDKNLIRLTGPQLIHDQFAQKRPIPKNGGKVKYYAGGAWSEAKCFAVYK